MYAAFASLLVMTPAATAASAPPKMLLMGVG